MPFDCGLSSGVVQGTRPDAPGEAAGLPGDVAAAVVGQPLDLDGQAIEPSEPVLDGGHHEVAHVLARDWLVKNSESVVGAVYNHLTGDRYLGSRGTEKHL